MAALQADFYGPLLQHPRHFVLLTAPWHTERVACETEYSQRSPRYVLLNGELKRDGFCAGKLEIAWHAVVGQLALYRHNIATEAVLPTRHDVDLLIKIVQTFVDTAKSKYGVGTTIMFIPHKEEYLKNTGYTEADIVAAFRKSGADVLENGISDEDYDHGTMTIPGDPHPTALANRIRAKSLLALIRKDEPDVLDLDRDTAEKR